MRRATIGLLVSSCLLALAACSNGGDSAPTSTGNTSTTTSTVVTVEDDGILRLGLLAPLSGPGADIGSSIRDAASLAVTRINESGGIGGRAVRLIVQDEGADLATAGRALEQLSANDVDAVIGPTSSSITLSLLDTAIGNGMLTCSPTASALALDGFPDRSLFFRTVPSDSMAAEALTRAIDQTGRSRVGVLYIDDAYGRALADAVVDDVTARSISVTARVPFQESDTAYADEIEELVDSGAEVVVVLGDATLGSRVVTAVLDSELDADVPVFVNDAMRGHAAAGAFVGLSAEARARIIGVGPRVVSENQAFLDELRQLDPETPAYFAANTYDCVNLIALSATAAGSTRAEAIAQRMQSTSTGGTSCATFADCMMLLDSGRNVDYDGPSGILRLSGNGDPNRGVFDLFGFDDAGGERPLGSILVAP